ncbi:nucleoside 2-deoxyribosyltransferase-like protein [Maribacter caenipelagi]|uniref:Nucleoside 2-deoxyribosyltransferase-like protein n=2 Tax=Maribacter caenipelagi TaxID=1447781 RepID=A0A4R7D5Z2_9FLAO|nr:nucleoside 2-deoxyribosyltransferase-like protein [Maribacter caenipelagi]
MYTPNDILPINKRNQRSIFLAGSMDPKQEGSWRTKAIAEFRAMDIFDPTNMNHDNLNSEQMKHHVTWELDALELSDIILLNFLPNAQSPISLVELGMYVTSNKLIVICPKEFYKSGYIHTLCEKYNTPIFNNITEAKTLLINSL